LGPRNRPQVPVPGTAILAERDDTVLTEDIMLTGNTAQTEDDQVLGAEPDDRTAGCDCDGCAPAARLVPLQRFGRHGRWNFYRPAKATR
jgi:hypothetical protein